jgi:arginine/lysine/ornithine decarboxylase
MIQKLDIIPIELGLSGVKMSSRLRQDFFVPRKLQTLSMLYVLSSINQSSTVQWWDMDIGTLCQSRRKSK